MSSNKNNPVEIHFEDNEFELVFKKDHTLILWEQGGDLNDFESLIQYLYPHIDTEKFNYARALGLAQALYQKLLSCHENSFSKWDVASKRRKVLATFGDSIV
jgi:hypothetical protein